MLRVSTTFDENPKSRTARRSKMTSEDRLGKRRRVMDNLLALKLGMYEALKDASWSVDLDDVAALTSKEHEKAHRIVHASIALMMRISSLNDDIEHRVGSD